MLRCPGNPRDWEVEVLNAATTSGEPGDHALAGFRHDLELDRPSRLLLDDSPSIAYLSTTDHITDLEFDEVTAAKLAVDCHIEQRTVPQSLMLVQIEPNGSDISGLQRVLRPHILAGIPGSPFMHGGVKI